MREYADVIDLTGNHLEANDFRREADEMGQDCDDSVYTGRDETLL